jgi:sulfonate transport system permease protein
VSSGSAESSTARAGYKLLRKLALPLFLIVAWFQATSIWTIHPMLLPDLKAVIQDFFTYAANGDLLHHTIFSMRRCAVGFLGGAVCGIILGILLGWYRYIEDVFDVSIQFLRSIPKSALAPLFIVWFGFGDLPKVLLVGLASFFYTLIPTIEGVKNVDTLFIKSARSMGAGDLQLLLSVIVPAALPAIYAGVRLSASTSLVVLVFVEIIAGDNGLGYMLEQARGSLNMSIMYLDLIILGLIGFLIDWVVRYTETLLMPWRKGKTFSV